MFAPGFNGSFLTMPLAEMKTAAAIKTQIKIVRSYVR
jgi:hypothetical protein